MVTTCEVSNTQHRNAGARENVPLTVKEYYDVMGKACSRERYPERSQTCMRPGSLLAQA